MGRTAEAGRPHVGSLKASSLRSLLMWMFSGGDSMRGSAILSGPPWAPNGQEEEDRITAKMELPAKTMDATTVENRGTR
jgi:hypothetical protein